MSIKFFIFTKISADYTEFNTLLAGDYIKCGSGMGIVFNIGKNTEIYKLALKISKKRKQKLPFQNKVKKFNYNRNVNTNNLIGSGMWKRSH